MRISPLPKFNNFNNKQFSEKKNTASFKGVYLEDIIDLGQASKETVPAQFLPGDALLLNKIAQEYPNQDCFIKKGYAGHAYLEFREKPPEVQIFSSTLYKRYTTAIDPDDKEYPCEKLILYPDSRLNRFIGMPSFISTNPSLPFTIKVGFELHKKLIEKKYQIKDALGKNDGINIGEESLIKRAHKEIEEVETALTRYLMECAFAALTDRASAKQIYASNYPKIQSRLDADRKLDLTVSAAKRPKIDPKDVENNKTDICEKVMEAYPYYEENKARIAELEEYMSSKGLGMN